MMLCALVLLGGKGCDGTRGESQPFSVAQSFGEVGNSPGQFIYPRALAADAASEGLWIIDKAGRIQRVDPSTGRASVVFQTPEIALGRPCGITIAPPPRWSSSSTEHPPQPFLYIADTHYHRVLIYRPRHSEEQPDQPPELIASFGRYGRGPGEFVYLTDVAVLTDRQGHAARLYVGEYGGNDRISIWEFDPEKKDEGIAESGGEGKPAGRWVFKSAFGSQGSGESPDDIQFDRPQSLAVDAARGRLVVTDSCNHRIGVFTLEGDLVRWIGSPREAGTGLAQMAYPFGLQLLEDGSALVTEYGNHRVRHVDLTTGEVQGLYGAGGRQPGELLNPWAVAMLGRRVYVLDSGNERVQAFDLPGRAGRRGPLAAVGSAAVGDARADAGLDSGGTAVDRGDGG